MPQVAVCQLHSCNEKTGLKKCTYCGQLFCKVHLRAKPFVIPDFNSTDSTNSFRMDEWRAPGGHPCIPFLDKWEAEQTEQKQAWGRKLDELTGHIRHPRPTRNELDMIRQARREQEKLEQEKLELEERAEKELREEEKRKEYEKLERERVVREHAPLHLVKHSKVTAGAEHPHLVPEVPQENKTHSTGNMVIPLMAGFVIFFLGLVYLNWKAEPIGPYLAAFGVTVVAGTALLLLIKTFVKH